MALKTWRERRLRAFQQQLSGLDSIFGDLGLDAPAGGAAAPAAPVDTAQMAKDILERSKTRYKFRDDGPPMKSASPSGGSSADANVQLDLFKNAAAPAAPPPAGGAPAAGTPAFDMNEDDIPAPPPGTTTAIKTAGRRRAGRRPQGDWGGGGGAPAHLGWPPRPDRGREEWRSPAARFRSYRTLGRGIGGRGGPSRSADVTATGDRRWSASRTGL
eukprot:TRINITY_DN1281_c0_g1_i2.p2 TRINITY_DN1281_c0_g1~~TRINITY_DN1281_c0_g1_i2.p2  ORF type:complete len:215 (-),score=62.08 TRINITY_DN1281_c0_g1_i2:134-778(-)